MTNPSILRPAEHELVVRVVAGDIRAFEAIYDRHSPQVFALAMRVTGRRRAAEDVTQDVFLNFWRTASSYDAGRGAVRTWLLAMVRNRSIDWLRREGRHERNVQIDDVLAGQLEAAERTEQVVADRDASRRVRGLLGRLPSEQRQVIELAYFNGLSQAEIAAKVNVPLGTVKGRQRLAMAKLQRTLAPSVELTG